MLNTPTKREEEYSSKSHGPISQNKKQQTETQPSRKRSLLKDHLRKNKQSNQQNTPEQHDLSVHVHESQVQAVRITKCNPMKNRLDIDESMTFDEWKVNSSVFKQINDSVQFWIGDFVNFGRKKFGRIKCNDELEKLGYNINTIYDFCWIAEKVESSLRKENLSFSHHKEVAKLEKKEQKFWLKKANENHWSVSELRKEIKLSEKNFNPQYRLVGQITTEERMKKVEELKKFILEFVSDINKVIRDTKRLYDYNSEFDLEEQDFKELGLTETKNSLNKELKQLIACLGEHGKVLSYVDKKEDKG